MNYKCVNCSAYTWPQDSMCVDCISRAKTHNHTLTTTARCIHCNKTMPGLQYYDVLCSICNTIDQAPDYSAIDYTPDINAVVEHADGCAVCGSIVLEPTPALCMYCKMIAAKAL